MQQISWQSIQQVIRYLTKNTNSNGNLMVAREEKVKGLPKTVRYIVWESCLYQFILPICPVDIEIFCEKKKL